MGVIIIRIITNKPPENTVLLAKNMLSEAQLEKSSKFANETFQEALMYYDSAMVEWRIQNDRILLFRNYQQVTAFAEKSFERSENAIKEAKENISNTEEIFEIRIDELGKKIKNFDENFNSFPMNKNHRDAIIKCNFLYSEGIHAYKNKNYTICKSKLDSAEIILNDVNNHYVERLITYFREYPKWNAMVVQTINHSKKNKSFAIIVDKLARELLIYKDGEVFKRFTVELGANWIGDKQQQGDKTTPEGLYKVIDKKQNGKTRYYKALLLNYPNEDDQKRFAINKKNGVIKQGVKIGNLIEIHGNGGTGIDWTDGCIALKDTDIDMVFSLCPVGTMVTIVGSTKSLNELAII